MRTGIVAHHKWDLLILAVKPVLFGKCPQKVIDLPKSSVFRSPLNVFNQTHDLVEVVGGIPCIADIRRSGVIPSTFGKETEKLLPCPGLRADSPVGAHEFQQEVEFGSHAVVKNITARFQSLETELGSTTSELYWK
jgi:hypothetical protein